MCAAMEACAAGGANGTAAARRRSVGRRRCRAACVAGGGEKRAAACRRGVVSRENGETSGAACREVSVRCAWGEERHGGGSLLRQGFGGQAAAAVWALRPRGVPRKAGKREPRRLAAVFCAGRTARRVQCGMHLFARALAKKALDQWCELAEQVAHPLMRRFIGRLRFFEYGILSHCDYHIGTSPLEGVNNKMKVIQRKAYGFHGPVYFALKVKPALPGKETTTQTGSGPQI